MPLTPGRRPSRWKSSMAAFSYLRVTDNGCGIAREDVPVAFLRHATSKVNSQKDLEGIPDARFPRRGARLHRRRGPRGTPHARWGTRWKARVM